jgi:hypothetical protein
MDVFQNDPAIGLSAQLITAICNQTCHVPIFLRCFLAVSVMLISMLRLLNVNVTYLPNTVC